MAWSLLTRGKEKPPPRDLQAFLCEHYWLKREQLSGCADVFGALRIAGDDCFDFMRELSKFFGVDLGAYDWTKYHFSEGEELDWLGLARVLSRWFDGASNEPDRRRRVFPISVAHLEKVFADGRWSDPNPMPQPRMGRIARLLCRANQ
ncbi:DUF1493 family protein [Rhodoplanes sp. Z2-YC6860]|uniref:DUF1493 family protein n=1 Tax=Rhodoplanes sp. Z2-YC6860 TaxID=674703 RepID=UPI00078C4E41|nr:DUF1493 family protein [Rhodoplanes sp. Z2-YC6860]AMN40925.1 hypothetical protein RHPLAN_24870 [Rhodoplanes sp. Z2-YC6860]